MKNNNFSSALKWQFLDCINEKQHETDSVFLEHYEVSCDIK